MTISSKNYLSSCQNIMEDLRHVTPMNSSKIHMHKFLLILFVNSAKTLNWFPQITAWMIKNVQWYYVTDFWKQPKSNADTPVLRSGSIAETLFF